MTIRLVFLLCLLVLPAFADDVEFARWGDGGIGDWTTTNWVTGENDDPLSTPGYPLTNAVVDIRSGEVSISTQDVNVVTLQVLSESTLMVSNGMHLATQALNFLPSSIGAGKLSIAAGTVNVAKGAVLNLTVDIGLVGNGYLDFGSTWGATNGFPANFGDLVAVTSRVFQGGFRADAGSISMHERCWLETHGQEITFRGDWLNPDGTTTFAVDGSGSGAIMIGGNWFFGGSALNETVDTNGVSLIQVGGDALLTNVTITVGATPGLTTAASSYDLVRVPADKSIYTNGLTVVPSAGGGVLGSVSIDANRGGYNYLVLTPQQFTPVVTMTNPVDNLYTQSGTNILLSATASEPGGSITKVEFYADTNKVGEVTTPPYNLTWTNVMGEVYPLKAVATDGNGNKGESPVVTLNVQGRTADGRNAFITDGAAIIFDDGTVRE